MEGLALYLWYLLSSRDDSDSDEEVVELSNVRLPEITVVRKHEEPPVPSGTLRKRKRVCFAEPLHLNGSVDSNNTTPVAQLGSPFLAGAGFSLELLHSGHDYVASPLVRFTRHPDVVLERVPTEVEPTYHLKLASLAPISQNQGRKPEFNILKEAMSQPRPKKSNSSSSTVKDQFNLNKTYKPVDSWDGLLEQFGTKREDGDRLFDELIAALGSDDDENVASDVNDDDAFEGIHKNDSDSDSVEVLWEGTRQIEVKSNSLLPEERTSEKAYRELFCEIEECIANEGGAHPSTFEESVNKLGKVGVSGEPSGAPEADIEVSANAEPEDNLKVLCDRELSACNTVAAKESEKPKRRRPLTEEKKRMQKRLRSERSDQLNRKAKKQTKPFGELSKKQILARLAKEMRNSHDPREVMDENLFKATFGVSKEFANFLITSLTPHLSGSRHRGDVTPVHLKVLAALNFFTTGDKNKDIGLTLHMSQPSVSRVLSEVITALISTAPEPQLPSSDSEFYELYGLPDIVGAVDATHLPIKPPAGLGKLCDGKVVVEDPLSYKNSAQYHSINVEIVSSSSNRVLFCHTKLPGNSSKSMLWRKSNVRKLMVERHAEGNTSNKLIGYDCEPWLLTSCTAAYSDSPEQKYNSALGGALSDSARLTIGLLKGRFKCLGMASAQQALYYSPDKAFEVLNACCALHNLAMDFGEEMPDLAFDEFDLVPSEESNDTNWDGLEARNSYILEHFC